MTRELSRVLGEFLPEYMFIAGVFCIYVRHKHTYYNFCDIVFDESMAVIDITMNLSDPDFIEDLVCHIISADKSGITPGDWVCIKVN